MNNNIPAADPTKKASNVPYIIAIVVMALIAVVAILVILMLRPTQDNTALIATVVGFTTTTTASLLALMKSQETHLTVNSQLALWKQDFANLMRSEGAEKAVKEEQLRVAQMREKAVTSAALAVMEGVNPETFLAARPGPIAVKVEDSDPVKVIDTKKGGAK